MAELEKQTGPCANVLQICTHPMWNNILMENTGMGKIQKNGYGLNIRANSHNFLHFVPSVSVSGQRSVCLFSLWVLILSFFYSKIMVCLHLC